MLKKRIKWAHPLQGRTIIEAIADAFNVDEGKIWRNSSPYCNRVGGATWGIHGNHHLCPPEQDLHSFSTMKDRLKYGYTVSKDGDIGDNGHPYVCDDCGEENSARDMTNDSTCRKCLFKTMKVSPWIVVDGYCATRIIEGGNVNNPSERVAFIEKSARVRRKPYAGIVTDYENWESVCRGTGGNGDHEALGQYGFDQECRNACDTALVEMGYKLPKEK